MHELIQFGHRLNALLQGISSGEPCSAAIPAGDFHDTKMATRRRDPLQVPGSVHFASSLAYGNFVFANGKTIRCEGIPGISGVATLKEVTKQKDGRPKVELERLLTHFHFDHPKVMIEQHYAKPSTGVLIGLSEGDTAALLPGRASFSQYLILVIEGRPLANRKPMVMTAERVTEWPPIGSSFLSESETEFFDIHEMDNANAKFVAKLISCNAVTTSELIFPTK
jgi:hypothetical protein